MIYKKRIIGYLTLLRKNIFSFIIVLTTMFVFDYVICHVNISNKWIYYYKFANDNEIMQIIESNIDDEFNNIINSIDKTYLYSKYINLEKDIEQFVKKINSLSYVDIKEKNELKLYTMMEKYSEKLSYLQSYYDKYYNDGSPYTIEQTIELMDNIFDSNSNFSSRKEFVLIAYSYVGKIPYHLYGKPSFADYRENNFGTETKCDPEGRRLKGLDCSGFVQFVFLNYFKNLDDIGFSLWHTTTFLKKDSNNNYIYFDQVSEEELLPGDLGLTTNGLNHVGIYF